MNITIKQIRQNNLEMLIKSSGKSKGQFAMSIDTAPAYLSQIVSLKNKRGLGDMLARKIERKLHLANGWMDVPHDNIDPSRLQQSKPARPSRQPHPEMIITPETIGLYFNDDEQLPEDPTLAVLKHFDTLSSKASDPNRIPMLDLQTPKMVFSKTLLEKLEVAEADAYCALVSGNSMAPVLPHGAVTGIDTSQTQIVDGDLYAIEHEDLLRIKLIYKMPGGGLRLRSYNTEEWPDEHISPEQAHTVRILGRVFWWTVLRPKHWF